MGHQLDLVLGRPTPPPNRAYLRFDDEFVIRILDFEFPRAKTLIEQVGEDRFEDFDEDAEGWDIKNLDEAIRWITDETDLLVEHPTEYWNTR